MIVAIHLTEQQRQALEAQQGQPLEMVDPDSHRSYVLLAREVYERARHLLEQPSPSVAPDAGIPPAPAPADEGHPLRQCLRDLATPPAVTQFAKRWCEQLGLVGRKARQEQEERLKLQHYYGGKWIAFLRTAEGPVVVAVADSLNDPAFDRQLAALTADERRRAIIDSPPRLFDEQSEVLTPFSHES
jgi:hypothetical protein